MSDDYGTDSEVIPYQTEDGKSRLQVHFSGETAWLTQNQMAELFQTTKQNVSLHIKNIFAEKELSEETVVKEFLTTALEMKRGVAVLEQAVPDLRSKTRSSASLDGGVGFLQRLVKEIP